MLHPKVIRVVLDTNAVVSAIISTDGNPAKIIEMLFLEGIENYTTAEIIDEIKEVLERPKISDIISQHIKEFTLTNFEIFSEVITPMTKLNKVPDDPDDNKFLECAITANVQYIDNCVGYITLVRSYLISKLRRRSDDNMNKSMSSKLRSLLYYLWGFTFVGLKGIYGH